jgi:hypothetical protein
MLISTFISGPFQRELEEPLTYWERALEKQKEEKEEKEEGRGEKSKQEEEWRKRRWKRREEGKMAKGETPTVKQWLMRI